MTQSQSKFSIFFFLMLWCGVVHAGVLYVDAASEAAEPDGLTWSTAYAFLQDALSAARAGDEIRVARGVYYPDMFSSDPNLQGNRSLAFEMKNGIALVGGYAGGDSADPNARDWRLFESVLSGDLGGNDVRIGSMAALAADHTHDENSMHVVRASGVDETAILDGFTIRSSGCAAGEMSGAAGLVCEDAAAIIRNCTFIDNLGDNGGGAAAVGGAPQFFNCMFIGNWARRDGGGMYAAASNAALANCLFSGNRAAGDGGGYFHDGGHAAALNCTFSGNGAAGAGGGLCVGGGTVEIANCVLYEEVSLWDGNLLVRYSTVPPGLSGPGVIHADPSFVDPDGADNVPGTIDDNLRLTPGSPCINTGDPLRMIDPNELDLDGHVRINDGTVDMGAYEFFDKPQLIAHWQLDESEGVIAADSAGANDGTCVGNPQWKPSDGRIDGALEFDGAGDYVNCGNDPVFNLQNAITVSAWVRVEAFSTDWQAIVTKGDSAWRLQSAGTDDAPGTLEFACTGVIVPYTDYGNILGNIRVDDGQWHHVAGVYDGLAISLYVDGVLDVTSVASGRIAVNSYDVLIGENAEQSGRCWQGQIDDVRIYNYALSPYEIAALAHPYTTYHVDVVGGDNLNDGLSRSTAFRSIQKGISAARDGDTVLVWPGVYNEPVIFFQGKAITVRSAAEAAIVQAPAGHAFSFSQAEKADSVLSNFIIRNSDRAVFCLAASPTLKNLTIVNNNLGVESHGGGQPDIRNCILWKNRYGNTVGCESKYSWDWEPVAAQAHWAFDEGSGTTVRDSADGNHGTLYYAVWTTGQVDRAIEFDGEMSYVRVPHSTSIAVGRSDYTLSAWIRPTTVDGSRVILGKISSSDDKEYVLGIEDGRIRLDVERSGNNGRAYSVPVVTSGVWQHVAVTFDSWTLQARFYHNGAPVAEGETHAPITALPHPFNAPLWIGMRGQPYEDRGFAGSIDEVMIFNRVLSSDEIRTVYGSALDPMFADPANGDYHLRSQRGRYVPLNPQTSGGIEGLWAFDAVTSPCVDGGDPAERPDRERMPNGGRVNMGAYGNTPYASLSEWVLEGDVNRDGRVNLEDLAVLASEWLEKLPWAAEL